MQIESPELHTDAVVYEDAHLIAVHKPAGLLTVPGKGPDKQDCLITRLQQTYPEALLVHRLDMATSGLVVFARSAPIQRALGLTFEERRVTKRYVAWVSGLVDVANQPSLTINLPILVDWPNRPLRKIDTAQGQAASTELRLLRSDTIRHASLVELTPLTGRTHQLRVHMQAIGHPILGDAWYAPPEVQAQAPRLLLHARNLTLRHPVHGNWLQLEAVPKYFFD
jgi:tRNA pseudouridine32 synthase / 23S rRNA pseudouridine746 synthase